MNLAIKPLIENQCNIYRFIMHGQINVFDNQKPVEREIEWAIDNTDFEYNIQVQLIFNLNICVLTTNV